MGNYQETTKKSVNKNANVKSIFANGTYITEKNNTWQVLDYRHIEIKLIYIYTGNNLKAEIGTKKQSWMMEDILDPVEERRKYKNSRACGPWKQGKHCFPQKNLMKMLQHPQICKKIWKPNRFVL